jgi:hypothetical protein
MYRSRREEMKYRRLRGTVIGLSVVVIVACSGMSHQPAETTRAEGSPITFRGKIAFMENMGGYFVLGDVPTGEYFIMNENPEVLDELYKSGKTVTIEGRIVRGPEYLFIEKIDGKPYTGKQGP